MYVFITVLLSLGSCYLATSPYLYFIALLCQVKSLIVKLILDLDCCAETDVYLSRICVDLSIEESQKSANLRA